MIKKHMAHVQSYSVWRDGRRARQGVWAVVPGWTATLLFGFQPVAQLVRQALDFCCIDMP